MTHRKDAKDAKESRKTFEPIRREAHNAESRIPIPEFRIHDFSSRCLASLRMLSKIPGKPWESIRKPARPLTIKPGVG